MQDKRNNPEENENFQKSDPRNIRNQNNENNQEERLIKDKNNPYAKDDSGKQHQGTGSANSFEGQQTDGEAANRNGTQNPENNRDNRANDAND